MSKWDEQLDLLIRARTPIIWIRSNEEERVENLLKILPRGFRPEGLQLGIISMVLVTFLIQTILGLDSQWQYLNGLRN